MIVQTDESSSGTWKWPVMVTIMSQLIVKIFSRNGFYVVLSVACWQEKFRKLLDINESLGDMIDLISPTRELIKEGKILRIAARDGDRYERYMFLVSQLLCSKIPHIRYDVLSRMHVMNHNWSARIQYLHLQNAVWISHHSALSEDRIRQCGTSSGSRHKDTDQCL